MLAFVTMWLHCLPGKFGIHWEWAANAQDGDGKQSNRVSSMGKRHTDCPIHNPPSLSDDGIRLENHELSAILVLVSVLTSAVDCSG